MPRASETVSLKVAPVWAMTMPAADRAPVAPASMVPLTAMARPVKFGLFVPIVRIAALCSAARVT